MVAQIVYTNTLDWHVNIRDRSINILKRVQVLTAIFPRLKYLS